MSIELRPGTNDAFIFEHVVTKNEYRLPHSLPSDSIVLDIGAHAGMFSHLALTRGAGVVFAFEPDVSNLAQARRNLDSFGSRVVLDSRAVWRSDKPAGTLPFTPSSDSANTGGGTVIWDSAGAFVETIPFDEVMAVASENWTRPIDLVKLDCEGAEFPILLTAQTLHQVDRIVGEYHELRAEAPIHARVDGYGEFSLAVLMRVLNAAGFAVESEWAGTFPFGDLGLFFATRTNPRTRGPENPRTRAIIPPCALPRFARCS